MTDVNKRSTLRIIAIIGAGLIVLVAIILSQTVLSGRQNAEDAITGYARELGLDIDSFQACRATSEVVDEVAHDYADGTSYGVDSTPTWYINGIVVRGLKSPDAIAKILDDEIAKTTDAAIERKTVSVDDDASLGMFSAPVTIVEFSDFECPYCKQMAELVFPEIKKNYIDTGKAKFVFRDFPLHQIHPNAAALSVAAECAKKQNKFWEMHDLIFKMQDKRKAS